MEEMERFQRDITEVRYYRASECILPMPSNLNFPVRMMENCGFKTPLCVLTLGSDTMPLEDVASLNQSQTRKEAGKTYSHSLTAIVKDDIKEAVQVLEYPVAEDIYVVYKTEEGQYYMLYSQPGASDITLEIKDSADHTLTINYICKSNYMAVALSNPVF